jgi:hypothetical protein
MANRIDRCASCQLDVYLEEGVTNACACPERDFRILLHGQRQRNASTNQDFPAVVMGLHAAPSTLPEIDPGMLMSAAGRSEFEAAQQLRPGRPFPQQRQAMQRTAADNAIDAMFSAPYEPPMAEEEPDIDLDGDQDWTGDWRDTRQHNARVASSVAHVDLAAMWMQGTGIPYDPAQLASSGDADDFSFDTGEMDVSAANMPRGGGGGGRFRVDGGAPPRTAFNRELINSQGPMREATRVGQGGRFAVLREQEAARAPRVVEPQAVFENVRAAVAPPPPPVSMPTRAPSALQQARQLQASSHKPSAYDMLRSNPFK